MMLNLFLVAMFLINAGALWYFISLKIPELIAIPDAVIVERLHEDSAKVRIFILHFKTFYRQKHYRVWFWKFCEKIFYRLHIFFLRADNGIVALIGKIRMWGGIANGAPGHVRAEKTGGMSKAVHKAVSEYWRRLKQDDEFIPEPGASAIASVVSRAPRPRGRRIYEVRAKHIEKDL